MSASSMPEVKLLWFWEHKSYKNEIVSIITNIYCKKNHISSDYNIVQRWKQTGELQKDLWYKHKFG